jgi:hypothetical protein
MLDRVYIALVSEARAVNNKKIVEELHSSAPFASHLRLRRTIPAPFGILAHIPKRFHGAEKVHVGAFAGLFQPHFGISGYAPSLLAAPRHGLRRVSYWQG